MKIIEELYNGNLDPFEHAVHHPKAEKQLRESIHRNEDSLKSELSETQKETLEKLKENLEDIHRLEEMEMFTEGFRLGARLMLEVMEEGREK